MTLNKCWIIMTLSCVSRLILFFDDLQWNGKWPSVPTQGPWIDNNLQNVMLGPVTLHGWLTLDIPVILTTVTMIHCDVILHQQLDTVTSQLCLCTISLIFSLVYSNVELHLCRVTREHSTRLGVNQQVLLQVAVAWILFLLRIQNVQIGRQTLLHN